MMLIFAKVQAQMAPPERLVKVGISRLPKVTTKNGKGATDGA
jgi:hypothetical protein